MKVIYKNGLPNGKGIYIWNDGSKYIGDWKNNIKEGKGTYYWTDGGKYVGDWKNN